MECYNHALVSKTLQDFPASRCVAFTQSIKTLCKLAKVQYNASQTRPCSIQGLGLVNLEYKHIASLQPLLLQKQLQYYTSTINTHQQLKEKEQMDGTIYESP